MHQQTSQEKTNVFKNEILQLKTMQLVPRFRLHNLLNYSHFINHKLLNYKENQ